MPKFYPIERAKRLVDAYFAGTDKPTLTGLARVLGVSRRELAAYDGFNTVVREAKMRVEEYLESKLGGSGERGAMFALRTNFRWGEEDNEVAPAAPGPETRERPVRELSDEELMAIIDGTA